MRFLLKVSMDVESANTAVINNRLGETIKSILDEQKPEAVYFAAEYGTRTAYVFLDMQDASQIPALAEPWFLAFNASIELYPAMVPEDLMKAGPDIERAAQKYA